MHLSRGIGDFVFWFASGTTKSKAAACSCLTGRASGVPTNVQAHDGECISVADYTEFNGPSECLKAV